ncbi:MAG: TonB-dependent receptor [Sulfurimonas sp.]|jgi:iron complex outermembrane receptor protein
MKTTIKLSLISVALLSQIHAEEVINLKPLTITSTAIQTDELKSTDAIEVYTSEDIEKAHVQNVYEFLNSQTSVTTMPSYGNPFSQLIDIHGYGASSGNQNIVITINGRKLNNIDGVSQLLSSISPASVSRIEIIKSGGIVTAGDGANGGVINITTKKNNDKEVTFYGGTYGVLDGSFYFGHSDEKISISASGEAQKSSGSRAIDSNDNKDENKLSTGTFALSYAQTKELELRLGASFARTDVLYASYLTEEEYKSNPLQKSNSFFPSTHQLFDTDAISAGSTYKISDDLSLKIDGNHENKKSLYVLSDPSYYNYNSAKISLDYVREMASLSLGYDGFYGDRKASSNTTTKNNNAGFLMSELYLGENTIKAGYRFEDVGYRYNDASKDLNQNEILHGAELGYNHALSQESSLFVNYAHSYQAPNIDTFFKTDYSNWPIITSSFDGLIKSMQANNYTLGYNNINAKNKFKASVYFIDLRDEIYLHMPDYKNTNINKSHKYGLDVYDKYLISDMWNVALNYNFVQAIIDEEKEGGDNYAGNKLPGVSDHNAKATLSYLPTPHATIALTQNYRSEAYAANDFNNNFSQKQDAYMTTDISATYAKDTYEVFAKINNLFNQSNGMWIQDNAIYPMNFTTTAIAGLKLKY